PVCFYKKREGDAKCSILKDGGWNARSCDGVFPGFRRSRRRTGTSASSDNCAVRGRAGSTRCSLRSPLGSTPRPNLRFTSIRTLAITGGRTQSTMIHGGGSATTAPDRENGTRHGARLPTASGSPSITSRTRAHEKNEIILFRGKSRIACSSPVIYPVNRYKVGRIFQRFARRCIERILSP